MNQQFSILGLGPGIDSTEPLVKQLTAQAPVIPQMTFLPQTEPSSYVEAVTTHRPQILLLGAQVATMDLGGLPEYFSGINPKYRPQVFLLLDKVQPFFQQQIASQETFFLKQVGPVRFDDVGQIAFDQEQEDDYLPISPTPHLLLSEMGQIRPIGNLPLSAFESVQWKDRKFTGGEFFELISYLLEGQSKIPDSKSFYLYDQQLFLRSRFHIKEFDHYTVQGMEISHIKGLDESSGDNDTVYRLKLTDAILEQGHLFYFRQFISSPEWLKGQLGVKLESDHQVLKGYAHHHLEAQNFRPLEGGPNIPLDLNQQSNQINWPSALWAVPFFEGLKDRALEFDLPPEVVLTAEQISGFRERMFRQKEHLTERQKAYEGAKLMAAQEEDIKLMAKRKLELLGQLIKRADIFDVDSDEMILTLGQDCLVFYEDEMIARKISRHLQGSGKSLFFDIGGFSNLKGLLTYKTDHLVPFLTHGHILVTQRSQNFLLKKLEKIGNESDDQKPVPTDLTSKELSEEKARLQEGFENLACLEAWNLCAPTLADFCQTLGEEFKDRASQQVKTLYAGLNHQVALVSASRHLSALFEAKLPELQCQTLIAGPKLLAPVGDVGNSAARSEQINQENSARIDSFIRDCTTQILACDVDLIVIDQDPMLAQWLVTSLQQTDGLESKGYIILLHQPLPEENLQRLIRLNCIPLYFGRHNCHLAQSWRLHLG